MQSYQSARNLFSFLGFCAGALILMGGILAVMGGSATQSLGRNAGAAQFLLGAMPGIMMAAVGVIGQCMVQMGRASVDTAEYAQQSLDVSRKHMELSQQLLEQGKTTAASFASLKIQRPSHPSGSAQDNTAGASYASQPATAASDSPDESTPTALPATTAAAAATPTKAITHEEPIPLAPVSQDITYKDGMFVVDGRQFQSKIEALAFQKTLAAVPAK